MQTNNIWNKINQYVKVKMSPVWSAIIKYNLHQVMQWYCEFFYQYYKLAVIFLYFFSLFGGATSLWQDDWDLLHGLVGFLPTFY